MCLLFLTTVIFILNLGNCARILGVVPTASISHQVVFQPLWRELSLRGHHVTVLTTDPINDPKLVNLTEIDWSSSYKITKEYVDKLLKHRDNLPKVLSLVTELASIRTEEQLLHPDVQKLLNNENEHFDLLIVEHMLSTMFAFSERFKCPFIGMTSADISKFNYEELGNPIHSIVYPDMLLPFGEELKFFERLQSVAFSVFQYWYPTLVTDPIEDAIIEKFFGKGYPPIKEIRRKVSMVFINTDPIFYPVMPLVPAIVQVGGGTHRKPTKPLSQELKRLLDNSKQGFIYFSLGSNVKSADLPKRTLEILLQAFSELPFTVLWKFELEHLPNKPNNVFISKWYPQQDVFKHPNIKLFITQGGIQSIDEAIYDGIPMVGMPMWFDQFNNVRKMVLQGLGLSVDQETIDKEPFKETVMEVINNPKYRNKINEMADLARDQPMTGMEKAVWWTEYVLRHKGAKHLRSPAMDIPTYQYYLLDVIGFCLFILIAITYILRKLVIIVFKLIVKLLPSKTKLKKK